jgi:hypothetical protein
MLVGWKVNVLSSRVASVRYRALLPLLALESANVSGRLFANGLESNLEGLDALVIVKSFTADDLRLAQAARARGIRVLIDLCDNIFIGDYGIKRKGLTPAQLFLSTAASADCIVTTTEPLADAIRHQVKDVPVVVIPDGIDAPGLDKRAATILRTASEQEQQEQKGQRMLRQRVRNAIRRVRKEGIAAIPSLVGSVARTVGGAVARRMRHTLRRPPHGLTKAEAARAPESWPRASRIVWFGNHGAEHARFGMLDILDWRGALEALASDRKVELVVISNSREKYEASIRPMAIPSRYVEWSPAAVQQCLDGAAAVIIPNSLDPFSVCKSANRTVLALSRGVPVIATMTPALRPLADYIRTDDPLTALREVLADPSGERARALQGYRHAEGLYGSNSLQVQWLRVLEAPVADTREAPIQPYLAVVLHLVQDLDLALPILREAVKAGVTCAAWCTTGLVKKSPRVLVSLQSERIPFKMLPDQEQLKAFQFPAQTRVLLTVAETSLGPHRVPRLLTEAAVLQGRFAATLQHGFENVGLTYDDDVHGLDMVSIAAQRIYTWGPLHTLHPRAPAAVRARCVPVGCPKDERVEAADVGDLLPKDRPIVGIFENLHWHRYSEQYKQAFLENVQHLARAFPDVFFLVKPHHAGVWLSHRYEGDLPAADNLLIADPQVREWEQYTAGALLPHLSAVITTPSTVALDAARVGLPTAVAAGDLHLDNYEPLILLLSPSHWSEFLARALDSGRRPDLQEQSRRFVDRVLIPGNAAKRIVDDIRATAGP